MKKYFLSLALLAGVTATAQAQTIKYGLKAGASLTSLMGKDADDADNKFGFNGGAMANFGINDMVSVQPEVLYSMKGAKSSSNSDYHLNLNYIDVPVLVKVATGATGLFFELGPQVGFLMSSKAHYKSNTLDLKDNTKSVDFGYAGGLGFQMESGPMIGLRYNGGFSKIGKDYDVGGFNVKAANTRNSAFQLYVGFLVGGK